MVALWRVIRGRTGHSPIWPGAPFLGLRVSDCEGLKRWLPDLKDKEIEEKVRLFRDARLLKKGGGRSA